MHKRTFIKKTSLAVGASAFLPLSCQPVKKSPLVTNWAGNLTFSAREFHRPTSIEEARDLVRKSKKIKTFGTRHSFSDIADCPSEIISSDAFTKILHLDRENLTVTVEAGIRYGDLALYLQKEGFALHNLASLPHISVAGACATATHGSGDENGNLASIVKGMEIIRADGEIISLSDQDANFKGAVVHLGALGMITKLTLAVVPTFPVQQEVFEFLPLDAGVQHFHEIFSSGYSVSYFTDYSQDSINQVWIKRKVVEDPMEPLKELYGSSSASRDMHPIASLPSENCTDQMAIPGPWHERLPHFKMDFTPSNGDELQAEYFVDRARAPEVLQLIQSLRNYITPVLFISEIRSIKGDELWLSTAQGGDKIAFHFTLKPDKEGVNKLLPILEKELEPYGARPHWGKLFHMGAEKLEGLYPEWSNFKRLRKEFDPEGKFLNPYLERVIGKEA